MASEIPTSFLGWVAKGKTAAEGHLEFMEFTPKPFADDDVDIKITHCGVCASDIHTLRSGWGETDYPIVVGHEIVGTVVRKGKNVREIEVGDRVGVGAQCYSCLNCNQCNKGKEQYCPDYVWTYGMRFANGSKSYGGYAEYGRYPASFVFQLPESVSSDIVAPMLCGGLTVYSPLKRYGAGPKKTVGIVGIGGLGHFGVLFASALGASKVYAISRTRRKESDIRKMGATDFIATSEPGWVENNMQSIDLIISTANDVSIPMSDYLKLLTVGGTLVQCGVPEGGLPNFDLNPFIFNDVHLAGTLIGGRQEMKDMLQLVASKNIKSWIETKPMSSVNDVIQLMDDGKARFRYVLVN
ncbi:chaperonin 10-like protein [Lipomyces doorenjongii]|uniref:chaperonin 10-like protein n=1 Tax=Lipomyces doorenjongii TaxID=383834 RepID=UPI0034CFB55C